MEPPQAGSRRRLMRSALGLGILVGLLAACTSGAASTPTGTSSPGLRGFTSDTAKCHNGLDDFSEVVVPRQPTNIVICGFRNNRLVPLKVLSPSDGRAYTALIAALSLPDIPAGDLCGDIAGPAPIMAIAPQGSWAVSIPGDGCDRMRQEVRDALSAANVPPQFPSI
jgi:hypothetical protein